MLNAPSLLTELERRQFPYVVANLEEECDFTSTWVDHKKTTATAVSVLTAFRHKKIVLLTRELDSFFYKNALKGYKQGLENAGISFNPDFIISLKTLNGSESSYMLIREYLKWNSKPTAIIACRDELAAGAWQAIVDAKLIIGQDISIIGFDDLSWPAGKNLTTFAEPARELGNVAAEMLIERITYGFKSVEKRELEAPLILRSSVGPCHELSRDSLPLKLYKSA
jgi:LacI family transcriptional regulator